MLILSATCVLSGIAATALLCITPPPALTRQMLVATSDWILLDRDSAPAIERHAHKVIEYAIAGRIARTVAEEDLRDDVARIEFAVERAPLRILYSVGGAGVTRSARLAGPHFRTRLLQDVKEGLSLHAVGRVWSDQRMEWLYFDAFYDRPIVFRKISGGNIEILNTPRYRVAKRHEPPFDLYRLPGIVLNEYPRNFARYVVSRVFGHRQLDGALFDCIRQACLCLREGSLRRSVRRQESRKG